MPAPSAAWLFVKNLAFTVAFPCGVAVWIPLAWIATDRGALALGPARWTGLPFLALGAAVYLRCVLDFARALGTPAPVDPPRELVVRGLYRFVRNPMYLGVLSATLGLALLLASGRLLLYGLSVFALFNAFVLLHEEPALARGFGEAYHRYRAAVPRWLPRLRPWDGS